MTVDQYVTALHTLAQLLDTNGLSDLRFVGPDLGYTSTDWLSAMMDDPAIMAKLAHFGLHSYQDNGGGSTGIYDFLQQSAYPDRTYWMTEFNVSCQQLRGRYGRRQFMGLRLRRGELSALSPVQRRFCRAGLGGL